MIDRLELFSTGLLLAGVYTCLRTLICLLYEPLVRFVWQFNLGQLVAQNWPSLAQSTDQQRLSFLDALDGKSRTVISQWSFNPPTFGYLAHVYQSGLLIGLGAILFPEYVTPFLILMLSVVLLRGLLEILKSQNSWKTDAAWQLGNELLNIFAMFLSIRICGII